MVVGPERERLEDRAAREVVDVVGPVDLPGARPGRPAGDTVGQPRLEVVAAEPGAAPRSEILVTEAERAQGLGDRAGV
jgi:hypothetical protein